MIVYTKKEGCLVDLSKCANPYVISNLPGGDKDSVLTIHRDDLKGKGPIEYDLTTDSQGVEFASLPVTTKNPAAVALGHLGGSKTSPAKAEANRKKSQEYWGKVKAMKAQAEGNQNASS